MATIKHRYMKVELQVIVVIEDAFDLPDAQDRAEMEVRFMCRKSPDALMGWKIGPIKRVPDSTGEKLRELGWVNH